MTSKTHLGGRTAMRGGEGRGKRQGLVTTMAPDSSTGGTQRPPPATLEAVRTPGLAQARCTPAPEKDRSQNVSGQSDHGRW